MKIKFKHYTLMIILFGVFLALGSVSAQSTSDDMQITTDSSSSLNTAFDNSQISSTYKQTYNRENTVTTDALDDSINSSNDKTIKTATKYSTIYVNSQGSSSNTGEDSNNPTTLTNAMENIADNGTIILTTNGTSDVYNLTSSISISSSSSLTTLSIKANDECNITISGDYKTNLFYINGLNLNFANINFIKSNSTGNSAFYISHSNVNFTNCSFRDNYRQNFSSTVHSIYSTVNLYDCTFTNNTAVFGGVVYQSKSTLNIYQTRFYNNTAFSGGSIYSTDSNTNIHDSIFKMNNASFGGSIFNIKSNMTVNSSIFDDNLADYYGGAIIHLNPTKLSITDSQFISNHAQNGAAIYVMYANVNITKTTFKSNTASTGSSIYSYNNTIKVKYSLLTDESNSSAIYLKNVKSYDINENWWAVNNPDFKKLTGGVIPDSWILMTFTNTTSTLNPSYEIQVSLNDLSNSSSLSGVLPETIVIFTSDDGTFNYTTANMTDHATNTYTGNSTVYASIDNQVMQLNSKINPILYAENITVKNTSSVNLTIYQNNDITGTVKLKVNNQTRTLNANKKLTTKITLNTNQTGTIPVYLEYSGDKKYNPINYTTYISITPTTYIINDTITRLYNKNSTDITLPSSYSLVEEGQVTEIKSQGNSGSCVSFATIGAIESSVLKATNISMDLSENNVKNMFKLYSILGYQGLEPNDGGYDFEAIGYMASALGPVYEEMDEYSTMSHISNIFNSSLQIQNIYIVPSRQSFTDNDLIKEAIMKYGAVYTGIKSGSGTNLYNPNIYQATHAVSIVGWDDNYSKSNFQTRPPGDGAFIIRNSWGPNTGINGYQYVSYYDVVIGNLAYVGDYTSVNFAVDYNNNYNYTRLYQYDTVDYVYSLDRNNGQYWIKNKYHVDKNESIAAIGSYFMDTTGYQMQLYINDNLVTTVNSTLDYPGYRTIELDNLYRVSENDEITVILNIKQNLNSSVLYVPLADNDYPLDLTEGLSYLSFDGINYDDLYTYGGGEYTAPIKVYMQDIPEINSKYKISSGTILINTTTSHNITDAKVYYKINGQEVTDDEGKPITYNITDNVIITAFDISQLEEGNYNYEVTLEYNGYNITKTFNFTIISIRVEAENTTGIINTPLNTTIKIYDHNNNQITEGQVTFKDDKNNTIQQTNITSGLAYFNATFNNTYNSSIKVYYSNEYYDENTLNDTFTLTINKLDTIINIEYNPFIANETVNITAHITDENGNNVNAGKVVFKINGKTIKDESGKVIYVKVVNGTATIEYNIPESYAGKNITITVAYSGSSQYDSQRNTSDTTIQQKPLEPITFTNNTYESRINQTIQITVNVQDTNNGKVVFKINGKTIKDESGKVIYLTVSNNQATLNYTIPTSYKTKTYTLTAVYISNNQRIEAESTLTITS